VYVTQPRERNDNGSYRHNPCPAEMR
jgi:hypothetical protein